MLPIYVTCGEWRLFESKEWRLIVDEEKRGRLLSLQSTTSLEELKVMGNYYFQTWLFSNVRDYLVCNQLQIRPARLGSPNGSRTTCWFKFGKNGVDAENTGIYGSQSRHDFDRDYVEQYFNYMGMLAVEGIYSKMEALLNLNIHPVDILLMLAATEGDRPKIEELLRAGADYSVKDALQLGFIASVLTFSGLTGFVDSSSGFYESSVW